MRTSVKRLSGSQMIDDSVWASEASPPPPVPPAAKPSASKVAPRTVMVPAPGSAGS